MKFITTHYVIKHPHTFLQNDNLLSKDIGDMVEQSKQTRLPNILEASVCVKMKGFV